MYQVTIEEPTADEMLLDKVTVRITKEFKEWFKTTAGLKRWHHRTFRKKLLDSLYEKGLSSSVTKIRVVVE